MLLIRDPGGWHAPFGVPPLPAVAGPPVDALRMRRNRVIDRIRRDLAA